MRAWLLFFGMLALVGCRGGGHTDFAPLADERMEEAVFFLRMPRGDEDPEGQLRSDGTFDVAAPLSGVEERQISWLLDELALAEGGRRAMVVGYLQRFGIRSLPGLEEGSRHSNGNVRQACVALLAHHGGEEVVPVLRLLLADPIAPVALEAAGGLASLGHHEGAPLLIYALEAPDPAIRWGAIHALASIYGTTREYGFLDPAPVRREAVERWQSWWDEEGSKLPR